MPQELDGIVAFEAFKELVEGVGAMRPEEEDVIDKMQPEVGLFENGIKEVLFKKAHEQFGVGRGHSCAHVVPLTWRQCGE